MRSIEVTFSDGSTIRTSINGTEAEIRRYYLGQGQVFNIGKPNDPVADNVQRAVDVNFLGGVPYVAIAHYCRVCNRNEVTDERDTCEECNNR